MASNSITRKQTGRAISNAQSEVRRYVKQLSEISTSPAQDRVAEITANTVRQVLFAALQHAPVKTTGHANADATLQQAASIAALQARGAIHPAISCNINASRLHKHITESAEEWLHRNAPVLQAAGQAVQDVYRAMMMACTDALQQHQDTKPARQHAVDLAAHVSTVFDTVTNIEAVRERMPTPAADYSPFPAKRKTGKS